MADRHEYGADGHYYCTNMDESRHFLSGLYRWSSECGPHPLRAGAVDGIRNRMQELVYITLPSMGPQLLFSAVMQISAAFSVSEICMNLAGFPSTDNAALTWVTHAYDYGMVRFEMGYACAITVVLFLVM